MELMPQPLTLNEAKIICTIYQDQQGRRIDGHENQKETIEKIVLAPHDPFSQWRFFNLYMETRSLEEALKFYTNPFYDVIAIIRCTGDDGEVQYTYKPIRKLNLFNYDHGV